jgi:hypothetical protein
MSTVSEHQSEYPPFSIGAWLEDHRHSKRLERILHRASRLLYPDSEKTTLVSTMSLWEGIVAESLSKSSERSIIDAFRTIPDHIKNQDRIVSMIDPPPDPDLLARMSDNVVRILSEADELRRRLESSQVYTLCVAVALMALMIQGIGTVADELTSVEIQHLTLEILRECQVKEPGRYPGVLSWLQMKTGVTWLSADQDRLAVEWEEPSSSSARTNSQTTPFDEAPTVEARSEVSADGEHIEPQTQPPANATNVASEPISESTEVPPLLGDMAIRFDADDALRYVPIADAARDMLLDQDTKTPLVMAVHAPWGRGKTSLGHLIDRRISARPDLERFLSVIARFCGGWVSNLKKGIDSAWTEKLRQAVCNARQPDDLRNPVCWFNAWHHDDSKNMTSTFAQAVVKEANAARPVVWQILRPMPWQSTSPIVNCVRILFVVLLSGILVESAEILYLIPAVRDSISPLLGTKLSSILDSTPRQALTGVISLVGATTLNKTKNAFDSLVKFIRDPQKSAQEPNLSRLRDRIGSLMRQATSGNRKFFIFIDDLDRCRPANALAVLELVNQLLDHPNVVVIILADLNMLAAAAGVQYKDQAKVLTPDPDESKAFMDYGRRFVQKVIQVRIDLPREEGAILKSIVDKKSDGAEAEEKTGLLSVVSMTYGQISSFFRRRWRALTAPLTRGRSVSRRDVQRKGAAIAKEAAETGSDSGEILETHIQGGLIEGSSAERVQILQEIKGIEEERRAAAQGMSYLLKIAPLTPREVIRTENALRLEFRVLRLQGTPPSPPHSQEVAKWIYIRDRWPRIADCVICELNTQRATRVSERDLRDAVLREAEGHQDEKLLQQIINDEVLLLPAITRMDAPAVKTITHAVAYVEEADEAVPNVAE